MPPATYLEKVTALITRPGPDGTELLLFQHPSAGIQIPAGTVEEDEPLERAALREVAEETGLTSVRFVQYIGWRDELPPGKTHVILHRTIVYSRPNSASFNWAALPRGIAVRQLRRSDNPPDFVQITFEESDRFPDPTYISYQITGWVPTESLASTNRRHFFHLACEEETAARWSVFTDNHLFQPFWAPLAALPKIIPPQRAWLDFVQVTCGYSME